MVPFFSVESDNKELEKPPGQVNIFGIYTNRDKNARLFKYPTSKQQKIVKQVINPEKFVTSNKVVAPKEIPSDKQKGHFIIQAYNDKDKNIIITYFSTKLHNDVPKTSTIYFAIYYLHYKKKLEMIETIHNPFLFWLLSKLLLLLNTLSNSIVKFAIYYLYYKKKWKITKFVHKSFLFWPPPRPIEPVHNHSLFRLP